MVIQMPRAPQRRGAPPLPNVLQLRLSDVQRRYLLLLAAQRDEHMSEVVRGLIEGSLSRAKPLPVEGGGEVPLRVVLDSITEDVVGELAERHASSSP